MIPCPVCGCPCPNDEWLTAHWIAKGHGFSSPAAEQEQANRPVTDSPPSGGGRPGGRPVARQERSGSPAQAPELSPVAPDLKPDAGQLKAAGEWMEKVFFVAGGVTREMFTKLSAACREEGQERDEKWRDFFKRVWDEDRAKAVRVLIRAGVLKAPEAPGTLGLGSKAEDALPKDDLQKALAALKAAGKPLFLGDWQAAFPRVTEPMIKRLMDLGLVYEPFLGQFKPMEG